MSGIQPTGVLHLGNFLGLVKPFLKLQEAPEVSSRFLCVVDLHALTGDTSLFKEVPLRKRTLLTSAALLACGVDPLRSTLFVQSAVAAHTELCWLVSSLTPLGWLQRMTQYKSKAENRESVPTGLLTYPLLQAADILLYKCDWIR